MYQDSLKNYRDLEAVREAYVQDGRKEVQQKTIINGLKLGATVEFLHKQTGVPVAEIEAIKNTLNIDS